MEFHNKTKEEIISEYIALKEDYDLLSHNCQKEKANHNKLEFLLNERVKKSSCHNRISEIMSNPDYSVEEVLQKIANILPDAWQFPEITFAIIQINNKSYHSDRYNLTKWSRAKDIVVSGETIGTVKVSYQESNCYDPQNPFLKEEDDLLFSVARRIGDFIYRNRINISLNESELKYRNLIENINEVIYEVDPAGRIVYISPSIERLLGFKQEELIGKSFLHIVGENADYLSKRYRELREKGDIKNEYKIFSKSGVSHWINFSTKAIITDGIFKGGTGTLVDITDKKRIEIELQTSEALYKSILNASPDIITITDMEGKIKFSSPKMTEMFGLKQAEDAIGHSVFEFISEKDHQRALENITKMVNGEIPVADVYEGARLDGTFFDIEVNGEYIRDSEGRVSGLILVSRDISERKKAEEMLRQSEIRYKIFFEDNNSVMLMIAPETGEIKKANPAACRFYGWSLAELCSMNISQINTLSKEELKDKMQNEKEERENHFYFKHRLANGEVRDVEVYSGPILFDETTLIYSIVHDISERIRAEESLIRSNRLYAVISHVNQAIIQFKDKNTLLNEVCRIALDYGQFQMVWIGIVDPGSQVVRPVMVMGREEGYLSHIKQITLADSPEGHGPTATALREGNYYVCNDIATDPHMAPWKDEALKRGYHSSIALPVKQFGKVFSAINLYSPIPNFFNKEEIKLLTEVTENISYALESIDIERERNIAEEKIKDHNENLELKIQQRTEQLAETNINLLKEIEERKRAEDEIMKARKESERANMAKSEFLSRMSHELRTPLNSILGFAQLLEMGELNPGQKKGVRHIMRSGKHLLDLINEVLDISRIEAGQLSLSLEPVQIIGVINEMTDLVSGQADDRKIKIELVNSVNNFLFLKSDKQRLKQIMLNLINNAVKYNRPGGSILIETQVMPKNEKGITPVRILVRDTGFGIAEVDLPKLFNPFERIGAEKSETEGSGLGLSVVKKLTDAMGGEVGVKSVPGEGSTFWVEFPMSEESPERDKTRSELEMRDHGLSDKRGTILYIEDNISNIELVEEMISSQHLDLTLINNPNGRMALPLAIMNKPDLIFLDLNLPDIHGSEVLKLLQSDEKTNKIPVIVISADAMPRQIERLMASGAKRYITKPIDLNQLLKIIDEFVV